VLKDVARRYLPREIVDRRNLVSEWPLPEWFPRQWSHVEMLDETASSGELTELWLGTAMQAVIAEAPQRDKRPWRLAVGAVEPRVVASPVPLLSRT